MDCIANLPTIAAVIYNNLYRSKATTPAIDANLDWSANFCEMIGYKDPLFTELMRLYLTIHRLANSHARIRTVQHKVMQCQLI